MNVLGVVVVVTVAAAIIGGMVVAVRTIAQGLRELDDCFKP